ncbi:hypothetical protein HK098_003338 [Nowakowskiella sp. JEL0407]|nr:hypothetical protein HK098_003338 [Nowakowskiella sp. JEL0407]
MSDFFTAFSEVDFTQYMLGNTTTSPAVLYNMILGGSTVPAVAPEEFLPGAKLAEEGYHSKHPVVLIPGIVSTGLEVWSTGAGKDMGEGACGAKYFRKRMWGTMNQFRAIFMDRECWMAHMKLDPVTGLDPPGIKLRAALGLDAADYLFPGYWVWARIINNLAALGYDNNNMHLASYDWRLSFSNLETRDKYYSRLKRDIEITVLSANEKSVLLSHSMGSLIVHYFLQWVQSPLGANETDWPDKYLHRWVNIAGPMLGVPKVHSSMLSGEMKDTVQLNSFATYVLEQFFSKHERRELFRSWVGLASMFVKGGDTLWGSLGSKPPDDGVHPNHYSQLYTVTSVSTPPTTSATTSVPPSSTLTPIVDQIKQNETLASYSSLVSVLRPIIGPLPEALIATNSSPHVFTAYSASSFDSLLHSEVPENTKNIWQNEYENKIATSHREIEESINDPKTWGNPLIAPLPRFKSVEKPTNDTSGFKLVCFYGVGIRTERTYYYRSESKNALVTGGLPRQENRVSEFYKWMVNLWANDTKVLNGTGLNVTGISEMEMGRLVEEKLDDEVVVEAVDSSDSKWTHAIDSSIVSTEMDIENGVQMTDGDTTVPLLSLGYMCNGGWREKRYNPSMVPVLTREYKNIPPSMPSLRGGPSTSDHVDIMGNSEMLEDLLKIVAGKDDDMKERVVSQIKQVVRNVQLPDLA